jgi:hypothetical protein
MTDVRNVRVFPVITSQAYVRTAVIKTLKRASVPADIVVWADTVQQALDCLRTELPPLYCIDFSDAALHPFTLLEAIENDPWLFAGGIIALCNDVRTSDELEKHPGVHVLVTIDTKEIRTYLPVILSIVSRNRGLIYQHGIHTDMVDTVAGSFRMRNDIIEVDCYSSLVSNFLYTTRKVDTRGKKAVRLALRELLLNAMEHGNCEIRYEEKSDWLAQGGYVSDLIQKKLRDNPDLKKRHVLFEYDIRAHASHFGIADQGEGFDWRKQLTNKEKPSPDELHGRGLIMARHMTKNLRFNEKGNEVRFEIAHQKDVGNILPFELRDMEAVTIKPGETLFMQGDPGDFMYYIVKGTFTAEIDENTMSTLNANDLFIGETSFLLNQPRNATVQALTNGRLIKITKKEFMEALRSNPHYGLEFARIITLRMQRMNAARRTHSSTGFIG